jgi:RNA polymerase sigma-70 factor (ECF subfamily)
MPSEPPVADDEHARLFAEHRRAMTGAAYRILGSLAAAEDAVQETWLRWAEVDLATVRNPRAYLLRAASRQALNAARHQARLREDYVGPWLPEPVGDVTVLGSRATGDPADAADLAESVSLAMLVVLESLSPPERAAFVLREVFGLPFDEVATALGRTPEAARQLAHRAREHVRERAPRHPVDRSTHREVTERFLAAAAGGSIEDVVRLLSPDVVLVTDGGGKRRAALRPIHGVEKVLRFARGVMERPDAPVSLRLGDVNGEAAILMARPDGLDGTVTLVVDDGLITAIYLVRNPDKLAHVLA